MGLSERESQIFVKVFVERLNFRFVCWVLSVLLPARRVFGRLSVAHLLVREGSNAVDIVAAGAV